MARRSTRKNGKAGSKTAAAAEAVIGHNGLSDEQMQALALQWKKKLEADTSAKDAAVAAMRNTKKKMKAELGEARNARLRELWTSDLTNVEIADDLGVSKQRIGQLKKELGLPNRPPPPRRGEPKVTAEPAREAAPKPPPIEIEEHVEEAPPQASAPPHGESAISMRGIAVGLTPGEEFARVGGKSIDLSASQARLLAVLLRAAPSAVGVPFIISKVYPSTSKIEAEERLNLAADDLMKELPRLGLYLNKIKGVGISLGGMPE